jgi:hypothetical protein
MVASDRHAVPPHTGQPGIMLPESMGKYHTLRYARGSRLRITPDGVIQGLWNDDLALHELGPLHVRRASFVELNERLQCREVRQASYRNAFRRWLQRLTGQPMGNIAI